MDERYQLLSKEVKYIINFVSNWEVFDFDNLQKSLDEMKELQQKMKQNYDPHEKTVLAEVREQVIDYIENEAEIAMPIDELTHESGRSLSKKEYGHVLLKYLVKELREHFS